MIGIGASRCSPSSHVCSSAEAQAFEKASLQAMQQLIHRSCQTLALWKLLCDHQFSLIISEMPKVRHIALSSQLLSFYFEGFLFLGFNFEGFLFLGFYFEGFPFLSFPSLVFFHSQEFQDQIKAVSFKDVVVSGRELTGALVTALINVYIKDSASVDTVSAHLRDICPLLYSSDDSICSKVPEILTLH